MKHKSNYAGDLLVIALYFALIVAIMYGWVANIITVAHSNFSEITGLLILRIVGIFIGPLGVVLGYI